MVEPIESMYVGFSGLPGVGKTTAATIFSKVYDLEFIGEPVEENPWLELFYRDMERYGFTMQVYLLAERFISHQYSVHKIGYQRRGVVQDRTIYEDSVFMSMLAKSSICTPLENRTYLRIFNIMKTFLGDPDVIIYLDTDPEVALSRMRMRARDVEVDVTLEYLTNLRDEYEEFIRDMTDRQFKVIRLNWNENRTQEQIEELLRSLRANLNALFRGHTNRFSRGFNG